MSESLIERFFWEEGDLKISPPEPMPPPPPLPDEEIKRFDPHQARDPHTGEWIDTPTPDVNTALQGYMTALGADKVDGKTFRKSFAKALKGDHAAWLSDYSAEEFDKMDCYLAHEGKVGGAITEDGEAVSLFNLGGPRGSGSALLRHLVNQGATKLNCIGDDLLFLYKRVGFKVKTSYEWDDELAPKGWNYERDGRPPVYDMEI